MALLVAAPPAAAHALLSASEPGDGVSLREPPAEINLTFTEEPDPKLSSIEVRSSTGGSLADGSPRVDPLDARTLRVRVRDLDRGVYTVVWRVLSRVDGHFTAGAYAFGIRVDPSEIEEAEIEAVASPPLSPLEPTGRSLFYLGLIGVIGTAWVSGFAFADKRAGHRMLLGLTSSVAVAGFLLLAVAQQRASEATWSAFIESSIGRAVMGRALALALVAFGALLIARASQPSRAGSLLVILGGLAAMGVHVSAGHAATGRFAWVKIATQLVHFTAAAVWIGGLAALVVGIRGEADEKRARAVRRFSTVAGLALAILIGTGTARAVAEVGSLDGLVSTAYGRLVIAKVALLGLLVALGARNRWTNVPRSAESLAGLRRTSRVELGVAGVVLAVAGVLSSLTPARSVILTRPTSSVVRVASDFARSVRVRFEVTPGYPGANIFEVDVEVLRGREPVDGVRLRLSSSDADVEDVSVELERQGDVWRRRSAAVAIPGNWRAVVLVERGAASTEMPVEFHTRCRTPAPTTTGPPRIYDIQVSDHGSVQAYVDPGSPGSNEVHFTFFDGRGEELPMDHDPAIGAFGDEGTRRLSVRRFSAGHFVAGARLDEGLWVFEFDGATRDGEALNVCFEDQLS